MTRSMKRPPDKNKGSEEPQQEPKNEDGLDETEVEDGLLQATHSPTPSSITRQRMEEDQARSLRRAGLGEGLPCHPPVCDTNLHASKEDLALPLQDAPRRSVAFGPLSPVTEAGPSGWTRYESASRTSDWLPRATTSTAPPGRFELRPRRSIAPGASMHQVYDSGLHPIEEARQEQATELAYLGPSYGPCNNLDVQRLLDMIQEMVGEEATEPPPAYLRITKMTLPKPYNGKDNLDVFEIWVHNLLEFFRTLRITGPLLDRNRLRILGDCLSDDAASWMYTTVRSPSREHREWLFEEAIIGLFRRFIHRDTHLQAAQQFDKLRYDASKGGVASLYERLLYILERMWEKPFSVPA
ncbi:hypothetical protein C8Q78DRAFT_991856 [Trametes maxima]|nr:hypothetical protein C8Q78DRAFT_991856 [Trametes maxima]